MERSARRGDIVEENLPSPFVHYSPKYGIFLAFSDTKTGIPKLCSCTTRPLSTYYSMKSHQSLNAIIDRDRYDEVHESDFPLALVRLARERNNHPLGIFEFEKAICHRCNQTPPSLLWESDGWHSAFSKRWGWYVRQEQFRYGIGDGDVFDFQAAIPPVEVQAAIDDAIRLKKREEVRREVERRQPDVGSWGESISRQIEADDFKHQRDQAQRKLWSLPEDSLRRHLGSPSSAPSTSRGESALLDVVKELFPSWTVFQAYRPAWLDQFELDLYLPNLKLAFEFQGRQHYEAVEPWGGEQGLKERQARDRMKVERCRAVGVKLVVVDHDEPVTPDHIRSRLLEAGVDPQQQGDVRAPACINKSVDSDFVRLRSGEIHMGDVQTPEFTVQANYGTLTFAQDQIATIAVESQQGGKDQVDLNVGDRVSGVLKNESIDITLTSGATMKIEKDEIASITFASE